MLTLDEIRSDPVDTIYLHCPDTDPTYVNYLWIKLHDNKIGGISPNDLNSSKNNLHIFPEFYSANYNSVMVRYNPILHGFIENKVNIFKEHLGIKIENNIKKFSLNILIRKRL